MNDGNAGANYSVSYADNANSSIGKAAITVAPADVVKFYDGTLPARGTRSSRVALSTPMRAMAARATL